MTRLMPPARSPVPSALVDGVNLDAVTAAVRGCAAIDDLCSGRWGEVATYLPGRRVAGVRVASDHVVISVRGRWGVPVTELAGQVRGALAALVGPRRVDIVLADLSEAAPEASTGGLTAGTHSGEVSPWTTTSAVGAPAAPSSAPIIPTAAVIPPPSPPV
jgi:hypothetical protein